MKIVIINKSDATGGAAVVSRRLMEALRSQNVDARMLVAEKLSDSPFVEKAASPSAIKKAFISERLKIFLANGFSRKTLFKIDTGEIGLPLWNHPMVKEADAVLINWVNQGMLSLDGIDRILRLGKPVVWTMHDMWCMTGICHHAAECQHFHRECGNCYLLGKKSSPGDLSYKVHRKKTDLYNKAKNNRLVFVAVSHWLKEKSRQSSLLKDQRVEEIPNAFDLKTGIGTLPNRENKIRLLFGAARLDDPIKGIETLREATVILRDKHSEIARNLELAMFGDVKNPGELEGFGVPVRYLGVIKGEEVEKAYRNSDILISSSSYETLPGTLVEAQAFGCLPVCFNRGGQPDIITQKVTGFMTEYDECLRQRASNLADGILWAVELTNDKERLMQTKEKMKKSVEQKFSYPKIAQSYIKLIESMK